MLVAVRQRIALAASEKLSELEIGPPDEGISQEAIVTADELEAKLRGAFPDSDVEIIDLTGTSDHYQARIVSKSFEGKSKLEQHRLVYAALGEAMKGPVHALALSTYSPTQWEKSKN